MKCVRVAYLHLLVSTRKVAATVDTSTVVVDNVGRVYKSHTGFLRRKTTTVEALRGLSLEVRQSEIFGLIGPNGAGKTTLIKILTTLLTPTFGQATVLGLDVVSQFAQIRPQINFIYGGERGLYWRLSGYDNLSYFADLYHVDRQTAKARIERLLKMVGLWERRHERVEGYSKGMKQRLHIAKALINEPKVLFLDEPTIGLDPVAARMLRDLVIEVRSRGITIFLTSHYMWEMEVLCDRIAVLKEGTMVALDTPAALKRLINGLEVVELQLPNEIAGIEEMVRQQTEVVAVSTGAIGQLQTVKIQTNDATATVAKMRQQCPNLDMTRLIRRPPNLEDAYVKLVGGVE